MLRRSPHGRIKLKRRLAEVLEEQVGDQPGRIVGRLIVLLILVNLVAVTLESVPSLAARYGMLFHTIEIASLLVFTVEYLVRIWVAGEHPAQQHLQPAKARWRYVLSPAGIIDLLAVLPFWFAFVLPTDLRVKKIKYSAFIAGSSDIDAQLKTRGIETLLVNGTVTSVCCESTARDAMMLDYRVAMLSDGNASLTDEEHAASLNNFLVFFGDVMTTDEAVARLVPVMQRKTA